LNSTPTIARIERPAGDDGAHDGAHVASLAAAKTRELLSGVHLENTRWFAELITSRLVQAGAAGEADEELAAAVTPARLSRLHRRLTGESGAGAGVGSNSGGGSNSNSNSNGHGHGGRGGGGRGGAGGRGGRGRGSHGGGGGGTFAASFACMFPPAIRPYVRLIELADSHRLSQALVRALVAALHALDPCSRADLDDEDDDDDAAADAAAANDRAGPLTLSPGGVIPTDAAPSARGVASLFGGARSRSRSIDGDSGGGVTERMLAARAVGGVLGVLSFGAGASGAFYLALVPIRPRSRGERRSLRTLPGASLRAPLAFNPCPRRLSTPPDAFQLHPDIRSYGTALRRRRRRARDVAAAGDRRGGVRATRDRARVAARDRAVGAVLLSVPSVGRGGGVRAVSSGAARVVASDAGVAAVASGRRERRNGQT
jgi:hypothetical protein